jgi:putative PIN family toxin of toxin-antitoxin system
MIIVLDTNCLIQILPKQAEHRWLYDAILGGTMTLALTTEIILEYEETINKFYESETLGGNVTNVLLELSKTIRKDVYFRWKAITKDPDDDKYVDCGIAANAAFIITNDVHFKALSKMDFPKIEFLNLMQFKETWER